MPPPMLRRGTPNRPLRLGLPSVARGKSKESSVSRKPRVLAGVPEPVTVRVPAKINLALQVGERRADGYHELATVFQAVSLYDDVTATPATGIRVTVSGESASDVPTDAQN